MELGQWEAQGFQHGCERVHADDKSRAVSHLFHVLPVLPCDGGTLATETEQTGDSKRNNVHTGTLLLSCECRLGLGGSNEITIENATRNRKRSQQPDRSGRCVSAVPWRTQVV